MLASDLSKHWWLTLLRGTAAIIFGIGAFAQPGITLFALVIVFAVFAFVEGALAIASALVARRSDEDWWMLLIEGGLGMALGALAFLHPAITPVIMLFYFAAWTIVTGALRVATAIRLRKSIHNEWWMILGGLLSIGFGVFALARPAVGILAYLWMIGAWAIVEGASLVVVSLELRKHHEKELDEGVHAHVGAH